MQLQRIQNHYEKDKGPSRKKDKRYLTEEEKMRSNKPVKRCATSLVLREMQVMTHEIAFYTYQMGKNSEIWKLLNDCQMREVGLEKEKDGLEKMSDVNILL